jgi:two-component system, OmpR family, phosphate regulon response regulator PhoB
MAATILIVEDEPSIVELIAINLKHDGFIPIRAFQADQAMMLMKEVLPDLIVLDWMLPGKSGIQFLKELRKNDRTQDIPIIFITARSEEDDMILALTAGADDYITKPFSPRVLIARIQTVLRRKSPPLTDQVIEINSLRIEPLTHKVYFQKGGLLHQIELGPTEFKLLLFLATHSDRVYSRRLLLDEVWGDHKFITERTVDVHVKRLRTALSTAGCEKSIETIRGMGYRFSRIVS